MANEGPFRIVFDRVQMKPGCAILQALGGDTWIANEFDTSTWLVFPTPDMCVYEVTKEQLSRLVEMVHGRHRKVVPSTATSRE